MQAAYSSNSASGQAISQKHLFLSSLVPLKLTGKTDSGDVVVIWQADNPSSVTLCRPIEFRYEKETSTLINETAKNFESQIAALHPLETILNGKLFF